MIVAWSLQDYQGGENPLLIYLFIACALLAFAIFLRRALGTRKRAQAFYQACKEKNLPEEGQAVFIRYMKKNKEPLSPELLTNRIWYDKFLNRLALHAFFSQDPLVKKDLQALIKIRETLFPFPEDGKIVSSRQIPEGSSLTLSCYQERTSSYVDLPATLIDNQEVGLQVSVQEHVGVTDVKAHGPLRVFYNDPAKMKGMHFESYLMHKDEIHEKWMIQHSYFIEKEEEKELNIPATFMIRAQEEVVEKPITILRLKSSRCIVRGEGLSEESKGLLQCLLLDQQMSLPVEVESKSGDLVTLQLTSLSEAQRSHIRRAMR